MTWQAEIDELRKREELGRRTGGAEKINRQHDMRSGSRSGQLVRLDGWLEESPVKQKVGIPLEKEVLRRAKRRAADEGRPLSDLIEDALEKYLTAGLGGRDAVVAVSANEFGTVSRRRDSLIEFFRKSPLAGVNLDLARSADSGRRIEL